MQTIQSKPNFGVIAIICKLPRGRSLPPPHTSFPFAEDSFHSCGGPERHTDMETWLLHIFEIFA